MVASDGPIQKELEAVLNLRVAQQQSQEVAWNRRTAPKPFTEVRRVLHVPTVKVSGCKEALNAQEVSNALYGLQGMSSEQATVRRRRRRKCRAAMWKVTTMAARTSFSLYSTHQENYISMGFYILPITSSTILLAFYTFSPTFSPTSF